MLYESHIYTYNRDALCHYILQICIKPTTPISVWYSQQYTHNIFFTLFIVHKYYCTNRQNSFQCVGDILRLNVLRNPIFYKI